MRGKKTTAQLASKQMAAQQRTQGRMLGMDRAETQVEASNRS
jgi:hypothetical protein